MSTEDESEWADSGPFCRHWGDPSDCDVRCANCGHTCAEHGGVDDECHINGCNCPGWKEPD